jgi:dolichyl-phosphate-mannose--protein O-mannosyl transferase
MFTFYAIVLLPFMILAISYLAHELILNYKYSYQVIALTLAATIVLFLYFLPIQTAQVITFEEWQSRMWLESWI